MRHTAGTDGTAEGASGEPSAFGQRDGRRRGERRRARLCAPLDLRLELVALLADVVVLELDGERELDKGLRVEGKRGGWGMTERVEDVVGRGGLENETATAREDGEADTE